MTEKKIRGILLFTKLSSENNLFLKILTENDELLTGLCFGGSSKKKKNIYQNGYFLNIIVKNKNINFPNNINAEIAHPYFYNIFNDKYKLNCIIAITSLLNISIIEGQRVKNIFNLSEVIISTLVNKDRWIVDFFLFLLNLLKLIGYEIDYNKNSTKNYFDTETLSFVISPSLKTIQFPHALLNKTEKISLVNAKSLFKIFEIILQNHHLNNMNLHIPVNYLKFKKLIINFLSK